MTGKQRVIVIPGDQLEEGIDDYGGKDFEKRQNLRRDGKRHDKGQQVVYDQSITMEKSWVMMMDRTDKKHLRYIPIPV